MTSVHSRRTDAAAFTPVTQEADPAAIIEKQFGMKMPDSMKADFGAAFRAEYPNASGALKADDVWSTFTKNYIRPAQTAIFYVRHEVQAFCDGGKFVSVQSMENGERTIRDGIGDSYREAVVDAFHLTGGCVTHRHGIVEAPEGRQAYVIVGVPDGAGQTLFGVGIAKQYKTAEIMAATQACGRVLQMRRVSKNEMHPVG